MSNEKEVIENYRVVMIKLTDLIQSQIEELEKIGRAYGFSVEDDERKFSILFLTKHAKHFIGNVRFFCREIERSSKDFFYLVPVLRVQVESFATLMYIRKLSSQDKACKLLYETFIRMALIYKKAKTDDWEKMYGDNYTLHKKIIEKYKLNIPNNIKDFTRKLIEDIQRNNQRLPNITEMIDSLPSSVFGLKTHTLFPAKQQNSIYSQLSLYSHGNAMFITKLGREDFWIISINTYFMLFLAESLDKDHLNNSNETLFTEIFTLISNMRNQLTSIWNDRAKEYPKD